MKSKGVGCMKQFGVSLILAAVIVVFGTCPALSYRPPLDITANVTGNTITYSVFDPKLDNGLWTLLSNFSAYEFVSGNCIG